MQRYKAVIAYDGTNFSGYQVQPHKRTVQSVLESVLEKIHKGQAVKVSASGRTDAGVHARGQVIHFDSSLRIPEEKWGTALNALLPPDVSVNHVAKVNESFHARFNAVGKEYRYRILLSQYRDPFARNFSLWYPYSLNIEAMKMASKYLVGQPYDFTSFCSAKTEVVDKVRTIKTIEFLQEGNVLTLRFVGNGFLYNMVRILVGTLLEIGSGERAPEEIAAILAKRDRRFAGKTAPAQGLYLWQVFYDE
ncbi:tRNA pseudouridine(38-40) synthase TruA [Bacillus rubiinfantis]|uniref:tRNA pseudouridine(38-40) synthase TruA n=1 Tax=Bacillus rubiinfantis TaxID=1499680 RepID=UPI0005A85E00|nr:tRNA pseudouridine(38-40) synthase TruA [Bacillus rubiinfantis]